MTPRVTAVVLAYGDEPVLGESVHAVLASTGVEVDVVLVDNGCTTDAVERLRDDRRASRWSPRGPTPASPAAATSAPGTPAGTCSPSSTATPWSAPTRSGPGRRPRRRRSAWPARSLRLYDEPDVINSAGNPVHFSGLSWAGGLGEPATAYAVRRDVASATGAATAVRADRFARARWVRGADVRLLRGHRAQPAHLAARLDGALRARTPWCCTATSSPATRRRATSWSATACSWSAPLYERRTLSRPAARAARARGRVTLVAAPPGLVPPEGRRLVVAVAQPRGGGGAAPRGTGIAAGARPRPGPRC